MLNLTEKIDGMLEDHMIDIFTSLQKELGIETGDLEPDLVLELEKAQNQLSNVINKCINWQDNNLPKKDIVYMASQYIECPDEDYRFEHAGEDKIFRTKAAAIEELKSKAQSWLKYHMLGERGTEAKNVIDTKGKYILELEDKKVIWIVYTYDVE